MQADYIPERNLCADVMGQAFSDLKKWAYRLEVVEENMTNPHGARRRIQRAADAYLDIESDLHYFASDRFHWMHAFVAGPEGGTPEETAEVYSARAIPLMHRIKAAVESVDGGLGIIAERRESTAAKAERMCRWRT